MAVKKLFVSNGIIEKFEAAKESNINIIYSKQ